MKTPLGLMFIATLGSVISALALWKAPEPPHAPPAEVSGVVVSQPEGPRVAKLPIQEAPPQPVQVPVDLPSSKKEEEPVVGACRPGPSAPACARPRCEPVPQEPQSEDEFKQVGGEATPLRLAFGEFAGIEGVKVANWNELSATHKDMSVGWTAIVNNYLKGGPTNGAAWSQMMAGYDKLQKYGACIRGKLPSHVSNKNGEMTHPLIMANLLAGELDKAGCALTEDQLSGMAGLGEDYENRWKSQQALYTDMTLKLEKVLGETDLKQWFIESMLALLSPVQRDVAVDPQTQGIFCAELYNAGILLHCQCEFIPASTRTELKNALLNKLAGLWKVERKALENNDWILDAWLDQISLQIEPNEPGRWAMAWTKDVIICARAFADALSQYMRVLDIDQETQAAMRQNSWFYIPRITH